MDTMRKEYLTWSRIHHAPPGSGIYAWYYNIYWGTADIDSLISSIENRPLSVRKRYVKQFFERQVFRIYRRSDLSVILNGLLRHRYKGSVSHQLELGDGFITAIANRPEMLGEIGKMLAMAAPEFMSPIYVGMADNLHERLQTHRRAIRAYRDRSAKSRNLEQDVFDDEVKSFALSVVNRELLPSRLAVNVMVVERTDERWANYLEHLVNRTQFPVFGRK